MKHADRTRPEATREEEICEYDSSPITCPDCSLEFMLELPLLDIEHLAEIESLESFRPNLREHMLTLFSDSARASMNDCNSAWKSTDGYSLAMAAHRLKSSAASLGALRLKMLAAELEKDALNRHGEAIDAKRLEELGMVLEETILAYQRWWEVIEP